MYDFYLVRPVECPCGQLITPQTGCSKVFCQCGRVYKMEETRIFLQAFHPVEGTKDKKQK
jgi:hypothetical protein